MSYWEEAKNQAVVLSDEQEKRMERAEEKYFLLWKGRKSIIIRRKEVAKQRRKGYSL